MGINLKFSGRSNVSYAIFFISFLQITAAYSEPILKCEVNYAGKKEILTKGITQDPYKVEPFNISDRFYFKMVLTAKKDTLDRVIIYVHSANKVRPTLLQEAKYFAPYQITTEPYLLTGEQKIYSLPKERELIYSCWLGGVTK